MSPLISFFKVLRCIGLFPRRILTKKESNSVFRRQCIERNQQTVGPMSPFPLLMTIIFHITMIILNTEYMFETIKASQNFGSDIFKQIGTVSWSLFWIWTGAFAGWFILMNNEKLIYLNDFLILLKKYQKKDVKSPAIFPKGRLFWAAFIPIVKVTLFIIYYCKFDFTSTINKIIFAVTVIRDEFLKFMIEFTFWQIAKLYQLIVTPEGLLTVEAFAHKKSWNNITVIVKQESPLKISHQGLEHPKNYTGENKTENITSCLLQTENYLNAINRCAQYAMSCFNYVIMFQICELVSGILFSVYFGITYLEMKTKIILIGELAIIIPRLVLIATLSSTINSEVWTQCFEMHINGIMSCNFSLIYCRHLLYSDLLRSPSTF